MCDVSRVNYSDSRVSKPTDQSDIFNPRQPHYAVIYEDSITVPGDHFPLRYARDSHLPVQQEKLRYYATQGY